MMGFVPLIILRGLLLDICMKNEKDPEILQPANIELRRQRDEVIRLAEEVEMKKEAELYADHFAHKKPAHTVVTIGGKEIKGFFLNPYLFWIIFCVILELGLVYSHAINFLSTLHFIQSLLDSLQTVFLGLGTVKGHVSDPEAYKLYHAISLLLLVPKTLLVFLWLDSNRTGIYQTLVISPLTYSTGQSTSDFILEPIRVSNQDLPKPEYRSMFSRIAWSTFILLLSFGFLWALFYARDDEVSFIVMIVLSLYFGVSFCILRDYCIFFKLMITKKGKENG
jgi:hypothetical protein